MVGHGWRLPLILMILTLRVNCGEEVGRESRLHATHGRRLATCLPGRAPPLRCGRGESLHSARIAPDEPLG